MTFGMWIDIPFRIVTFPGLGVSTAMLLLTRPFCDYISRDYRKFLKKCYHVDSDILSKGINKIKYCVG